MIVSPSPVENNADAAGVRAVLYRNWIHDDGTFRIEFLSPGAESMLEATAEEIAAALTAQRLDLFGIDTDAFYASIADSIVEFTAWNQIFGYVTPKTKTRKWLQSQDFPLVNHEGRRYFAGVMLDITPLKVAEAGVREAYGRLTTHIDNTPVAVIEWDREWRVARWSGQAQSIFGWTADEVLGKRPCEWRFVHDDDAARITAVMDRMTAERQPRNFETNRNYTKDGHVRHCEWRNSILTDERGAYHSCLSLVLDITDRVHVSEQLARSEWRLRAALSAAGMLGWESEPGGVNFTSSENYEQYFGLNAPITAETLNLAVHPDDRGLLHDAFVKTTSDYSELNISYRGSTPAADGGTRWFTTRAQWVTTPDEPLRMIGVTADITDRKRAEEQRAAVQKVILESQKYESLGLLAGGVAHDFNNLLTVILGNASLAKMGLKPGDPAVDRLTQVEAACQRATTVCRQMLAYAGKTRVAPRSLDLSTLVTNSAELLRSAAGRLGKLVIETPAGLPLIRGEMQPLQQILLNLVTNSVEAYGGVVGTVTIRTGPFACETEITDSVPPLPAGPYVTLEVEDRGHGLTDDVKARMFDPFFTTKFTGRGLGLAAVMGIVRAHNGGVHVSSRPDHGCCIRVLIPVHHPATASKRPA